MAVTHHYVLCPYYQSDKNESITCEDLYRTFANRKKKYWWMRTYCEDAWESCPYAKELTEMYDRVDKGEDMDKEKIEQREKAWKKEQRNLSIQLGTAKKRIDRQQKKIDDLMAQKKDLYEKWRKVNEELTAVNMKIYGQMQQIVQLYEDRLAYLIDTKCDGELREKDVEAWAEGKEFAIVHDYLAEDRVWKVLMREEQENEKSDGLDKKTETE